MYPLNFMGKTYTGTGTQTAFQYIFVAASGDKSERDRQITELTPCGNRTDIFGCVPFLEHVYPQIVFPIQILLCIRKQRSRTHIGHVDHVIGSTIQFHHQDCCTTDHQTHIEITG